MNLEDLEKKFKQFIRDCGLRCTINDKEEGSLIWFIKNLHSRLNCCPREQEVQVSDTTKMTRAVKAGKQKMEKKIKRKKPKKKKERKLTLRELNELYGCFYINK